MRQERGRQKASNSSFTSCGRSTPAAASARAKKVANSLPQIETLLGVALLIADVVWAVRTQPSEAGADAHPN